MAVFKYRDPVTENYVLVPISVSGAEARQTISFSTASLAPSATASGTVLLFNSYRLLSIETNRPARVRLYTTVAKRDADAPRALGVYPTGDHGLILEYITTASLLSADLTPVVDGFDGKATPDGYIPWSITNTDSSAGVVTTTLKLVKTE